MSTAITWYPPRNPVAISCAAKRGTTGGETCVLSRRAPETNTMPTTAASDAVLTVLMSLHPSVFLHGGQHSVHRHRKDSQVVRTGRGFGGQQRVRNRCFGRLRRRLKERRDPVVGHHPHRRHAV